jgi:hypothetical protein
MWAEQAIFTSLARDGLAGYHVVARSPGISDEDTSALDAWSPTQGSLILDAANRVSVNFHPMPEGRYALSRTCEGPPEYSGRGGRQLYTHALVFAADALHQASYRPLTIYRDALALGHLYYAIDPPRMLPSIELGTTSASVRPDTWAARARALGLTTFEPFRAKLAVGQCVQFSHRGDRLALVECLLELLCPANAAPPSFSTSLQPSAVRPFQMILI